MTLITNEIHLLRGTEKAFIISTADRRLTFDEPVARRDKYKSGQKLFKIGYLNATVSFWGNFYITEGNKVKTYSEWLPNFIRNHHDIKTLNEFAFTLREKLNIATEYIAVADFFKSCDCEFLFIKKVELFLIQEIAFDFLI